MKTSKALLPGAVSILAGLTAVVLITAWPEPVAAQEQKAARRQTCLEFSELHMSLEQNATDGDIEVVIFVKGQDAGLKSLSITGPNRKRTIAFRGSSRGVGIREFVLESAEPPDLDAVLRTFPEGDYTVVGRTVDGDCIRGVATLSHQLAPATTLLTPTDEQVVPIDQLTLSWAPVASTERYIVELNNENTGAEFTFQIFPPVTSLAIPPHFLQAGAEYQFVVGVKTTNGNSTFVERTFFIAP